ncbi:hypothetical protein QUC31_016074 [Theobroma cacao]|uniref:Translation elongation factor EF1B/ribosomal protein S6 family protein n=1 Tax=Theobroma cacao TaxID=3641 RepID=A0A061EP44_THECC|nr:Translation elongation factor EF1B/ribosomal protein S6 family protein [Theobroma cacao]
MHSMSTDNARSIIQEKFLLPSLPKARGMSTMYDVQANLSPLKRVMSCRFNPLVCGGSQLNTQEMAQPNLFYPSRLRGKIHSRLTVMSSCLCAHSIPAMESLLQSPAKVVAPRLPKLKTGSGFFGNQSSFLKLPQENSYLGRRKLLIVEAKKNKNKDNKQDSHSFIPKPDETTGFFPEAVLLKEKKVQEDGKLLPEFADDEEQELYESLNLQLQSALNVERMRHYEVVYLIHEKHAEEVGSVNEKVQDFLREKRGRLWRLNDWGLRRLAYKIKKAKNAHYILMNFELEARWINEFKTMLDKDERVIRHLVIKRDEAITEDCPPPPEWHTLRAGGDDYDEEEDDADYDVYEVEDDEDLGEDWDGEDDSDIFEDNGVEDGIIAGKDDDIEDLNNKSASVANTGKRSHKAEKVAR